MESNKTHDELMNKDFQEWLHQNEYSTPFIHVTDKACIIIVKIKRDDNFDFLYTQRNYININLVRNKNLEYAGIYFRKNKLVYDGHNYLDILIYDNHTRSKSKLFNCFNQIIKDKIESIINNDKNNLDVAILQKEEERLNYLKEEYTYAKDQARQYFLDDDFDIKDLTFKYHYYSDQWDDEQLLSYITDPEAYENQEVQSCLAEDQQQMLDTFLVNDMIRAEYKKLEEDKDNPIHIIKKIIHSFKHSRYNNAQNVNVKIIKNGINFDFKTASAALRSDPGQLNYSTWFIEKNKREEFYKLFGVGNGYKPEEIISITYRKDTLYQKEE